MSMHLESPALSLVGKKKGKKKFASSYSKQRAKELDNDWQALMKKWEPKQTKKIVKEEKFVPTMPTAARTVAKDLPSKVTPGGDCTKKKPEHYTGDNVLGIAVLHKSCLQPIFNTEAAKDVAKMRR